MSGLTDVLKDVAPALATALGGPLAGAAVSFLSSKLGVDPAVVQQTVAGMGPADLVKMKELDLDFQKHMADNRIALQLAQIGTNTEEAKSTNWFIAGPRPAVMWVCVVALALAYWPKAVVLASIWTWQAVYVLQHAQSVAQAVMPPFPDLGVTDLLGLLGSVLGLSTMRTVEKVQGAEGNR